MNTHPSSQDLLRSIPDIERLFTVTRIPVPGEDFQLLKFAKEASPTVPLLILMAGCHGEEPAPVLVLFEQYRLFAEKAATANINLAIYPLVNPWGFDRNNRYTRQGLNCADWISEDETRLPAEVKVIREDIVHYRPCIFANLHEDDQVENEFYLLSFGDRSFEPALIETENKYFPIAPDGEYEDGNVIDGAVYDAHDGSAEDFMSGRSTFSCCLETPSRQPLPVRKACYTDIILKLIELTAKKLAPH